MTRFIDIMKTTVILAVVFFFVVVINCTFWETLKANGRVPPPNKFQWEAGWNCTCDVFDYYLSVVTLRD